MRRAFRLGLRRPDVIREELDEELRFYVDARVEHLVARGWTPEDARAESLRRLGDPEALARLHHSAERREGRMALRERLESVWHDVRLAARGLRREPLFTGAVVAILALGIGANAATFGIADRLLLRGPSGVTEPRRVVRWYQTEEPRGMPAATTSLLAYPAYDAVGGATRAFSRLGAYAVLDATTGRGAEARKARAGWATASFFPTLGARPALGRFYDGVEDAPSGARRVAVLSHAAWRRDHGGDPAVLGRTVVVDEESYTVVGVAAPGFDGVELGRVDVWLPLSLLGATKGPEWRTAWYVTWLRVVGRLAPGVTAEQAGAQLAAAYRHVRAEQSEATGELSVAPLAANGEGREASELAVSRWLVGVSVAVLVIACSNVVNLLLARAVRRRREVAVRVALGAGSTRLARLFLIEGAMLAAAGAAMGLLVAALVGGLARRVLLPDVAWASSAVGGRVIAVAALLALATGVVVALVPALQARSASLTGALRAGARDVSGARPRLRGALTAAQAALSFLLLVGAGLFVRSLRHAHALDLGFEPDRVLLVSVAWPRGSMTGAREARERENARRIAFMTEALERARRLPGVARASLMLGVPYGDGFGMRPRVPGLDSIPRLKGGNPQVRVITAGWFATVGTPLLKGRDFTAADRAGSERVTIVSRTMAETLWPGRDPLGACIIVGGDAMPCTRVVGVVADTRRGKLLEDPAMQYYLPLGQEGRAPARPTLLLRTAGDPAALATPARRALLALDPALGYVETVTLRGLVDPQTRAWRLGATMFGLYGGLALLVAGAGLYSLVAYLVAQRTREIGVRLALGATAGATGALVVRRGAALAAIGVAIGAAASLGAGRFIAPLLFDTSARDPLVFGVVAGVLLLVAVVASLVPAARARRVDAAEALRAE